MCWVLKSQQSGNLIVEKQPNKCLGVKWLSCFSCRLLGRTEGRLGEKPGNQEFQKLRRHIPWLPVRPLLSSEYSGVSIPGHTGMAPKPSQVTDAQSQEETYRFCRQENIFQFTFFWFAWRAKTEAYEYL